MLVCLFLYHFSEQSPMGQKMFIINYLYEKIPDLKDILTYYAIILSPLIFHKF